MSDAEKKLLLVQYFKMIRSANEFAFDILGSYCFIYFCSTRVSDFKSSSGD